MVWVQGYGGFRVMLGLCLGSVGGNPRWTVDNRNVQPRGDGVSFVRSRVLVRVSLLCLVSSESGARRSRSRWERLQACGMIVARFIWWRCGPVRARPIQGGREGGEEGKKEAQSSFRFEPLKGGPLWVVLIPTHTRTHRFWLPNPFVLASFQPPSSPVLARIFSPSSCSSNPYLVVRFIPSIAAPRSRTRDIRPRVPATHPSPHFLCHPHPAPVPRTRRLPCLRRGWHPSDW